MAVALSSTITPWSGGSPAPSGSFTPAAGVAIIVGGIVGGIPNTLSYTGTGTYSVLTPPGQHSDLGSDVDALAVNASATAVSQTISLNSTPGGSSFGWAWAYSGVDTTSIAGAATDVSSPGTGVGAIHGSAVVVPTGGVLLAIALSLNAGVAPTSPTGTNRGTGSNAGLFFCATEYAGAGASITPSFTTTAGTDNLVVWQWLLPPSGGVVADNSANTLFIDRPGLRLGTPVSKLRSPSSSTGTTSPPFVDQTAGIPSKPLRLGTPLSRLRSARLDTGTTPPPFIDQTTSPVPRSLRLGTPMSRLRSAVLDTGTTTNTNQIVWTSTGGIILGGTGSPLRFEVYTPTGGLIFGGTAPVSFLRQEGTRSGGLIFGGSSPDLRKFVYTSSGGLLLGGTGSPINIRVEPTPSGGLVFGGSAGYSTHVSSITWVSTGGILLGGSAPVQFIHAGGGGALQKVRKWSSIKDLYSS